MFIKKIPKIRILDLTPFNELIINDWPEIKHRFRENTSLYFHKNHD